MAKTSPKKEPAPSPGDVKASRRAALVAEAVSNPFAFFTSEETGLMFGFGENTMTTLRSLGAPIVARQMHPGLLLKWIETNADRIPKIRGDEE